MNFWTNKFCYRWFGTFWLTMYYRNKEYTFSKKYGNYSINIENNSYLYFSLIAFLFLFLIFILYHAIRKVWFGCHFSLKFNMSFICWTENNMCDFNFKSCLLHVIFLCLRNKWHVTFWIKVTIGTNFINGRDKKNWWTKVKKKSNFIGFFFLDKKL